MINILKLGSLKFFFIQSIFFIFSRKYFFVPNEKKNFLNPNDELKNNFFSCGNKNRFLGKRKNKKRQEETWTLLVFCFLCPFNVILFT